jgi:hypothetical protein
LRCLQLLSLNQVGHVLRCGTLAQRRRARISIDEWGTDDQRVWEESLAKGMNPDKPTRFFCGKLRRVATRPSGTAMSKHPNFGPVMTSMEQIDAALARAKAAEAAAKEQAAVDQPKKPASGRRRRVIQALEELKQRNREMARR